MFVLTAQEMQAIDQMAINDLGIPSLVLMENAGVAVINQLEQEYGDLSEQRILILVGKGNNGGDGLVVARHLLNRNAKVIVYVLGEEQELSAECRHNLQLFIRLQGEVHQITNRTLSRLKINLNVTDLVIDALYGTGFVGKPQGISADVFSLVNNCRTPVVAIDVPSGLNCTSGIIEGTAIKAELTIVLGFLKTGLLLYPGAEYCGKIKVVDIGIPKSLARNTKRYLTTDRIISLLPNRPAWGHKNTFGHGLVVAGSPTYAGAAHLTATALLRAGAGLVTLAVPQSIASRFPPSELIIQSIPESSLSGSFGLASIEALLELFAGKDTLVIGPGLGRDGELTQVIERLLTEWQGPLLLDADGLNSITDLAWLAKIPSQIKRRWIFTPHPGEMARLLGTDSATINENRMEVAWETYQKLGVNIVLKGAPTIIAGDNRVYINSSGNSGLATAGTGDVLSGIIAALLCQGMEPFLAAVAGVYLHGKAADHLIEESGFSRTSMIASDILQILPKLLP